MPSSLMKPHAVPLCPTWDGNHLSVQDLHTAHYLPISDLVAAHLSYKISCWWGERVGDYSHNIYHSISLELFYFITRYYC